MRSLGSRGLDSEFIRKNWLSNIMRIDKTKNKFVDVTMG